MPSASGKGKGSKYVLLELGTPKSLPLPPQRSRIATTAVPSIIGPTNVLAVSPSTSSLRVTVGLINDGQPPAKRQSSKGFTSLPCAPDTGGENPNIDTQDGLKA